MTHTASGPAILTGSEETIQYLKTLNGPRKLPSGNSSAVKNRRFRHIGELFDLVESQGDFVYDGAQRLPLPRSMYLGQQQVPTADFIAGFDEWDLLNVQGTWFLPPKGTSLKLQGNLLMVADETGQLLFQILRYADGGRMHYNVSACCKSAC